MFKICALAGALLLSASQTSFAGDRDAGRHPAVPIVGEITPCVPGVVYVKFKANSKALQRLTEVGNRIQSISKGRWEFALDALGAMEVVPFDAHAPKDAITHSLGIDRMYCIYFKNVSIDPHTALTQLLATGEIENGSARYMFPLTKQVNDPLADQEYALTAMNVYKAWDHTTGDTNVIIADVDCAINIDHEDLKDAVKLNWGEVGLDKNGHDKRTNGIDDDGDGVIDDWQGVDVVGSADRGTTTFIPDGDPRPDNDQMSHGTETAGCISATANNSLGVAGIAYGCKLLPIKASDNGSNITGGYEGIQWAVTRGAKVVNCSWGGPIYPADVPFANTLLQQAIDRNVLVVAAAGNNGTNNDVSIPYPSNGPGVLSVGATDASDAPASFSDFGKSVAVWAPGSGIVTTSYPGNSSYAPVDGTSFASPYTAGVAALLVSMHPDWTMKYIARQLVQTCDDVVRPSNQAQYWGRLNAQQSIEAAPKGPGLIITGYSVNGVPNDSLGAAGVAQTLTVSLKNVVASGTNLIAHIVPVSGLALPQLPTPIGSIDLGATGTVSISVTRSALYSEGSIPVQLALTDNNTYTDTLTLYVPLKKLPGFRMEETSTFGSSIKQVSNSDAWAAFGLESGSVVSECARETNGIWNPLQYVANGTLGVYCVEALDTEIAWFGTSSTSGATTVYSTLDGGQNWSAADVHTITPFVNTIHFFDELNGIFIGDPIANRYGIAMTNDGGDTWKAISARPSASGASEASWNNSTAWVGNHGWFGSNSSRIYRTTDGGLTWKFSTTPYTHSLAIAFADDTLHGLACFRPAGTSLTGSSGITLSVDGGLSWKGIKMPDDSMQPSSVRFVPGSNIAFVSSDRGVYRTEDFGTTWTLVGIPYLVGGDVTDIGVYRGNGEFTVSLLSGSAGVADYHEAIADPVAAVNSPVNETGGKMAELLQSSPNPMSGTSTISFELPRRESVRLSIQDAVGREVAVLANGMVESGAQSVAFHAENLPAGVYYYTLTTENGERITRSLTVLR